MTTRKWALLASFLVVLSVIPELWKHWNKPVTTGDWTILLILGLVGEELIFTFRNYKK